MFSKVKKNKKGFTIIETLISSGISLILLSTITNFLWNFNSFSTRNIKRNELSGNIRVSLERLKKEVQEGSRIVQSYTPPVSSGYTSPGGETTIETNSDRVIFTRAVYKKNVYIPATNDSLDTDRNDVIVIEYTGNIFCSGCSEKVQSGDILYSYFPAPALTGNSDYIQGHEIIKQKITGNIINSNSDHTYNSTTKLEVFKFFNKNGNETFGSNIKIARLVEVNLTGRTKKLSRESLKTKIRLRNYRS